MTFQKLCEAARLVDVDPTLIVAKETARMPIEMKAVIRKDQATP